MSNNGELTMKEQILMYKTSLSSLWSCLFVVFCLFLTASLRMDGKEIEFQDSVLSTFYSSLLDMTWRKRTLDTTSSVSGRDEHRVLTTMKFYCSNSNRSHTMLHRVEKQQMAAHFKLWCLFTMTSTVIWERTAFQ